MSILSTKPVLHRFTLSNGDHVFIKPIGAKVLVDLQQNNDAWSFNFEMLALCLVDELGNAIGSATDIGSIALPIIKELLPVVLEVCGLSEKKSQ